nr:lipoprotein signal peptide [Vibrio anguillarum]
MKWTHLLFATLLFLSRSAIATGVGFTQITLTDDPKRLLDTAIWYPTQEVLNTTLIGDNPAFIGTQVIKDAQI